MRKIEQAMNVAINSSTNWAAGNTTVKNENEISEVYLHGNLIAKVGETWLQLWDCGYQTATTKSRLNAILHEHGCGEYIYQENFEWFMENSQGEKVPFESGMILK